MKRRYEVCVEVEIDDPDADDPEMEYAAVATAVAQAAQALTHRAEGYEPSSVTIRVEEIL